MCASNCNKSKKIIEGDIKNHNATIKKPLWSYKLFQWGNLVMIECCLYLNKQMCATYQRVFPYWPFVHSWRAFLYPFFLLNIVIKRIACSGIKEASICRWEEVKNYLLLRFIYKFVEREIKLNFSSKRLTIEYFSPYLTYLIVLKFPRINSGAGPSIP